LSESEKYLQSAGAVRRLIGDFKPDAALILGSGLGFLGDRVQSAVTVPYAEIPHFSLSTAPGHAGRLIFGELSGRKVAVMQGRLHYYEGYSFREIAYPVRVLRLLGADTLIVTNAAGGICPDFSVGDLMLITDHLKFFHDGPLRGENEDDFGTRFPDMTYAYTPELQRLLRRAAEKEDIALREGVYAYFPGPQFETPAEIRALKVLGASAVGMSTVPEVITAAHAGMKVLGVSLICNMAAGMLDQPLTGADVDRAAREASESFARLILRFVSMLEIPEAGNGHAD
jgi:purine-nucleoside phosphorylase